MSVSKRIMNDQKGQAIVLVALFLAIFGMFVGLAVDGGAVYLTRQRLNRVVDAAATVGGKHWRDNDHSLGIAKACDAARLNDMTVAGTAGTCPPGVSVTVESLTSPDGSTQDGLVVTASRTVPGIFIKMGTLLGCGAACEQVNVTARAAAIAMEPPCIYVTNPTAQAALDLYGSGAITVPQCGIHVASNHAEALDLNGNTSIVAKFVEVVGGTWGEANVSPPPINVSPRPDPLKNLPEPTPSGSCNPEPTGDPISFFPGRYCTIHLGNNETATFAPGEYYIDNGFTITGNATASGTEVTFFIAAGALRTDSGSINFTAPTTGTYAGLNFFQSRTNTTQATITGSNDVHVEGVYIPKAALDLSGGSCGDPIKGLIVADTMEISGSICLTKPDELPAGVRYTPILVGAN